jgi:hypothetical protein
MKIRANIELSSLLYFQVTYCERIRHSLGFTAGFHIIKNSITLKKYISDTSVSTLTR